MLISSKKLTIDSQSNFLDNREPHPYPYFIHSENNKSESTLWT